MKKVSNVIEQFRENLILKQLEKQNKIPITAFINISEIDSFCEKHKHYLIWENEYLIIAYEWITNYKRRNI